MKNKPHVAILHYTALPIVGGVENVIADHTRLLLEAGYPVTLLAGRGGEDRRFADARVVVVPEMDSEHSSNLDIARALDAGYVTAEFAPLQARIEKQLAPVLAEQDILIVHNVLNYHFNLPLTAALHRLLDRGAAPRTVAWCHDISRYVNPSSGVAPRFGFPWDLIRTYRHEITYVAVSARRQRALADTLGYLADCIRVIPNGVAAESLWGLDDFGRCVAEEFDLMSADLILLMPVRITRAKNIEFALRVTAALKASGLTPRLLVTGPPDPHVPDTQSYFRELLALRGELGLSHEAVFLHEQNPSLDSAAVAQLYRVCDMVLLPSHREGFGLPVLEGGLMGKAIFTSNVPAVEQVGVESVHLIAPEESADHIATRMREWAEPSAEFRLKRQVRQQFTWRAIFAREIEPLIRELSR